MEKSQYNVNLKEFQNNIKPISHKLVITKSNKSSLIELNMDYDSYKNKESIKSLNLIYFSNFYKNNLYPNDSFQSININKTDNFLENSTELINSTYYLKLKLHDRFWIDFIICIFCTLVILATLIGNTLVILAVMIVKKLHTKDNANNYLIVSLAISDLLVGVLVLPFALHIEIKEGNKYDIILFTIYR